MSTFLKLVVSLNIHHIVVTQLAFIFDMFTSSKLLQSRKKLLIFCTLFRWELLKLTFLRLVHHLKKSLISCQLFIVNQLKSIPVRLVQLYRNWLNLLTLLSVISCISMSTRLLAQKNIACIFSILSVFLKFNFIHVRLVQYWNIWSVVIRFSTSVFVRFTFFRFVSS